MRDSKLTRLLSAFSPVEQKELRKFLCSPFFNTRHDLVQLFDFFIARPEADKGEAWQHLFPTAICDDQKLRLLMSYLYKLIEQYIAVKAATADPLANQLHLAIGYREHGMQPAFEHTRQVLAKSLEAQPLRDAGYHQICYRMHWEQYQTATSDHPSEELPISELAHALDVYYLSTRLRLICLAAAQQGVYQSAYHAYMDSEIIALAENEKWVGEPAIATYLHCYRMIRKPEEELHFQHFKRILLESAHCFAQEEMRGLYLLAINYCIRRLNDGERRYFREVLDLYKAGLAGGQLLENGVLSRFTYHNIVAAGLQLDDYEWVSYFIHEYKNALERPYRESSFSFNLARLEFSRRRYDAVLDLLQRANYRDPLLNLSAKTLLLKTWYALGETDILHAHLDAMRNYIRRKRVIGYHRSNYLNIVKYADKLLKMNPFDQSAKAALSREIAAEEILTEKEWLLGCVEM